MTYLSDQLDIFWILQLHRNYRNIRGFDQFCLVFLIFYIFRNYIVKKQGR